MLIAVAWGLETWLDRADTFAPLGPYEEQTVTSDRTVNGKPAFSPGEQVMVRGTKCSTAAVQVFGTVRWIRVVPPGLSLETGQGSRFAEVGCVTQPYANDIPPVVAAEVEEAARTGDNRTVWRISGIETPIDSENGRNGETATWLTEPFVLLGG